MTYRLSNTALYRPERAAPGAGPPVITAAQPVRIQETGELFDTMAAAVAAAAIEGLTTYTLEIIDDVVEPGDLIIGAGAAVKIIGSNGAHTVTFAPHTGAPYIFNVTGGAKLTLGDGTQTNPLTIQHSLVVTDGEIYIQDGIILQSSTAYALLLSGPNVTGAITGGYLEGIQSGLEMEKGANLTEISGGYFAGMFQAVQITSDKTTYNTYGKNTRVNLISGGSFYQTDPTTTTHGQAIFLQNDAVIDLISGGHFEAAKNNAMIIIRGAQVGEISGGDFVANRVGTTAASDRNATLQVEGQIPSGTDTFQNTTTGIGRISGGNYSGAFFGLLVINYSSSVGAYVTEITGGTFLGTVALQNDVNANIGKITGGQITGTGQGMLNNGNIGEIGGQVTIRGGTSYGIYNYAKGKITEISGGQISSTGNDGILNAGTINLISGGVIQGRYNAVNNTDINYGHLNIITGGVFWGLNGAAISLGYPLQLEPGLNASKGFGRYMGANGVIFNNESLVTYPYSDQFGVYYEMSTATVPVPGVTGTEFKYLTPRDVYAVTVNGSYAANTGAGDYLAGTTAIINAGSRSGYTFAGWTVNAGGITLTDANSPITTFIMPANDVTVTANWVANSADLAVTKTGDQNSVHPGDRLSYIITVTNNGPNEAENVTVTDAVPTVLTGAEYSVNGGADWLPWPGSYVLGTLLNGASLVILIRGTVSATATGTIINTAVVSSTTSDPDSSNNTAINVTDVTPIQLIADLAVIKTGDQNSVHPGDTLSYTITAVNHGPDEAQNVTVTDAVPDVLTGAEFSINGGADWFPWPGSYAPGTLLNGASFVLLIRGTVNSTANGTITNTAVVSSTSSDPDNSNNTAIHVATITPIVLSADLAVTKIGDQDAVEPDDMLIYTITVVNNGPDEAQNVTVTDAMPTALENTEFSVNGGADWLPWTGSHALGTLLNGDSSIVLIRGTVSAAASGTITNTAVVSSTTADPDSSNNTAINVTTVTPTQLSADLAVTKIGDQSSVQPGDRLSYTIEVVNNGPDEAQNVTVTDAVPDVLTGAEFSVNGGADWFPWPGSHALGTLLNGDSYVLLIRGTVHSTATGTITNTAVVSSTIPDPDNSNNTAVHVAAITPIALSADLAVTKFGDQSSVQPGDTLNYIITVANHGPDEAQNVTVTDAVPAVLENTEFSLNSGADWLPWTGSYAPGTLLNGDSLIVLIRGTVSANASGTIINTAVVSSTTADPDRSNNTAINVTDVTPIQLSADLAVTKYGDQSSVQPGETLSYIITLVNHGPDEAQNITVTDALPAVLTGAEFSINSGVDWLPWPGSYALGTLLNGDSFILLIRGAVSSAATGTIINTAVVSSTTPDPDRSNNTAINVTEVTPIALSADLAVTKTGDQTSVLPGDRLSYTVTVINHGPNEAQNVTVIDAVPAGLTGAEFSINGGAAWLPWPGSYVLGTLQSGAVFTLLLRGRVSGTAAGDISNTSVVTSTTPDPNLNNNTSTSTVPMKNRADLSVVKTACPHVASPCGRLAYALVVSNFGPHEATNVMLTEQIPNELCQVQYSLDGQRWCQWCSWNSAISLGNLPAGAAKTVLIRGIVHRCAAVSMTNTATVASATPDPNLNNNQFTLITPIRRCRR